MSPEEHKAIARRLIEEAWNQGDHYSGTSRKEGGSQPTSTPQKTSSYLR